MTSAFNYRNGTLHCEDVKIDRDFLETYGTPAYIYSKAAFRQHYNTLKTAFSGLDAQICYSVKSCSNLSVLKVLAEVGSHFDVVSAGEIERVLTAGGDAQKIVFAGVGKRDDELAYALEKDIHHFNVESAREVERLNAIALEKGKKARVVVRLNPDVDPKTHRYITTGKDENKFGLNWEQGRVLFARHQELPGIEFQGIHTHIGSQIQDAKPYVQALERTLPFAHELRAMGLDIKYLNIGGGYGIDYKTRTNAVADDFAKAITPLLKNEPFKILLEPGRSISANAGILVTRVTDIKSSGSRRFLIVDAGMNDLIRPCLYEAYHEIWPLVSETDPVNLTEDERGPHADVVGPICESGDFLGLNRRLPGMEIGDGLAVFSAGAYGFVMASNYNTRGKPPELLIDGAEVKVVRRRETVEDQLRLELEA
ncbi:MAG: diaminopimelate decarboxylase [Planctomycetota bacterium]|nr:diaminopimelate decarboxylase [Planctomycetota bacterium]